MQKKNRERTLISFSIKIVLISTDMMSMIENQNNCVG